MRYQVFVSSTYADLKEERRKVTQALMEMDCIPAGMELFPAIDEEQFEFIKKVIDDCDYYVLIVGGRYGSTTPEGVSYTEKEYEYAVERGIPVLAFIHEDPNSIPFGKSESDPALRERLDQFRAKVASNRIVRFWTSSDQLPGLVALSLNKTIKMSPATGWIRANRAVSPELLTELNELRKEVERLRTQAAAMSPKPVVENLAALEDKFRLSGIFHRSANYMARQVWDVTVIWRDIFAWIAPYLIRTPNDEFVKSVLTDAAFRKSVSSHDGDSPNLDDQVFRTVAIQLQALRLVTVEYSLSSLGSMNLFWKMTPAGERLMLELRTVKKSPSELKQKSTQVP